MSRINRDVRRFNQIGENHRMDLKEFIKHGQLGKNIKIPIKIIELPEFEYDKSQKGGIGKGDAEVGDPVDDGNDGDKGDGSGKPGDDEGEHEYYQMNPEEFAKELDNELGLDFEEKGKKVVEKIEGDYNDTRKAGPNSTLDKEHLFKQALKRHAAMYVDTEYIQELLKVRGYGVEKVWEWVRENNINISKSNIEQFASDTTETTKYESIDDIGREYKRLPPKKSYKKIQFRSEDEIYRSPEIIEKPQNNAVVINIRDVSGSMREKKRELVERILTPMDWYLQGKYDNVDFVYVAHDASAWIVNRDEFFGIQSGGGTKISSAYELIQDEILPQYPWESWNRFIFAAGDGENMAKNTKNKLIPLMKEIKATRHAYVEVQPKSKGLKNANVGDELEKEFHGEDKYRIARVNSKKDVLDAIQKILDNVNED